MLPIEQTAASLFRPARRSQSRVLPSRGAPAPDSRGAHAPPRVVVGALANHNQPSSNLYLSTQPNAPRHPVPAFSNQPETRNPRHYLKISGTLYRRVPPRTALYRLLPIIWKKHFFSAIAPQFGLKFGLKSGLARFGSLSLGLARFGSVYAKQLFFASNRRNPLIFRLFSHLFACTRIFYLFSGTPTHP